MAENEKEIKYIMSDLFDRNDYFDMITLSVLTAKDDLNYINILLDEKKEDTFLSVFILKLSLGIAKNAHMLAYQIFKNESYINKLKSMNNWKEIEGKYKELVECNGGNGTDSFSFKVLNEIRNQAFHYSYKKPDLDNISKIVEELKNDQLTIKIYNEGQTCYSMDVIFINYMNKVWKEYVGDDINNESTQIRCLFNKIKEITILTANLFNLIIIGYFSTFTNFEETWADSSIKLTNLWRNSTINFDDNFKNISDLDSEILDGSGLYCIRLKENSSLPERYQNILDKREFKYLYIGKATTTLRSRLNEELEHLGPGTFFRSIGCVLGFTPMPGHLAGLANQNNYRFSDDDKMRIIDWLNDNIEVSIVKYEGDFNIEAELIEKYCPLLNSTHNPKKLQELKDDRRECRRIARGELNIL